MFLWFSSSIVCLDTTGVNDFLFKKGGGAYFHKSEAKTVDGLRLKKYVFSNQRRVHAQRPPESANESHENSISISIVLT